MNRPGSSRHGPLSLTGRTALVTGVCGGIGSAVAAALLEAGCRVVGVDLPQSTVPPDIEFVACDLADPSATGALFADRQEDSEAIDILIHAAGITRDGLLWKISVEDWNAVMRVNLDSAFHLVRGALPGMRARGGGSVVLVSSINGERGKFGQSNYAASKAGLIGFGRTAARELGKFGIRVNLVAPGLIETPMTAGLEPAVLERAIAETALGRAGQPEDVAQAILFLASDMARHVTGQVLRVDGGQLMA